MRCYVAKVVIGCMCVLVLPAVALAEKNECAVAYEHAQELRADGHLREARRALQICVQATCPDFVRTECGRWLSEVEASLPSLVLVAKRGGNETEMVRVFYDDEPLVEELDGKAVPVDPGQHTLKLVTQGAEPKTVKIVIREGEKNRQIVVEFSPPPEPTIQPVKASAPLPTNVATRSRWPDFALAGVGVAGVAGFVTFGLLGNSQVSDRERTCAPTCNHSQVDSIRTKYLLADVSLGVGVVALAVSGYLLFSPTHKDAPQVGKSTSFGFDVAPLKSGGFATLVSTF